MASEHEALRDSVAALIHGWTDLKAGASVKLAGRILADIAERTKEATIEMHHKLRRENRKEPEADRAIKTAYEYAAGDLAWRTMHAASALWPSHQMESEMTGEKKSLEQLIAVEEREDELRRQRRAELISVGENPDIVSAPRFPADGER